MAISRTTMAVAEGESSSSAVYWAPVFAGALVASAVTLLLMLLGSGLGLTIVSPWSSEGASATTVAVSTAVWLVIMQWVSAGVGGYLTGRLRTKWTNVHTDEIYFRDTAHGFLSWALATLIVAGIFGSTLAATANAGLQSAATVVSGAATAAASNAGTGEQTSAYFVDTLFRADPGTAAPADTNAAAEAQASRILLNSAAAGTVSPEDRDYLVALVAARTGLSQADAQARLDAVLTRVEQAKVAAQQAADTARKAAATIALVSALSLLIGAFIASVAAALGGRQRDDFESSYLVVS